MNTENKKEQKKQLTLYGVLARFFVKMYELMTFKIESKYDRWFEVGCGISVWLNLFVITYSVLKGLNVL